MNAQQDRMDEAIDAVAARMTRVEDNDALATRILASLPDRSPWSMHSWMPRLAITAALAGAVSLVVLRTFDEGSTIVLRSGVVSSPTVGLALVAPEQRTDVEPTLIVRRTIVERSQYARRTAEDFERSLEAIEGLSALSLTAVAPRDLPVQDALALAPLAIADLPLTAESISPR